MTILDLFDGAKMNPNCVQRTASTVPLQSLALLNSEFARARSKAFANRVVKDAGHDILTQIDFAFERAVGRSPTAEERASSSEFLNNQAAHYSGRADSEVLVLTDFCQMLFASSSFLYVE